MNEAVDFLSSLARCVSTMMLYDSGHPSRELAVQTSLDHLARLQEIVPAPRFTFLVGEVLQEDRPIRALRHWDWGDRLARHGIQRLEFTGAVTRDDFVVLVEDVQLRLTPGAEDDAADRPDQPASIRWGAVDVAPGEEGTGSPGGRAVSVGDYGLDEEVVAVVWILDALRRGAPLPMLEVDAVVRSAGVAMHGGDGTVIPLVRSDDPELYPATHALNSAVLAMSLAEFIGFGPLLVRALGVAGFLHDVGMLQIPGDVLDRPGTLSPEGLDRVTAHPADGARLLLESRAQLDLASIVAREHHLRPDGGGYPAAARGDRIHPASHLVQICDVFDALRSRRPHRDAWSAERALAYLEDGSGSEFDAGFTRAFVQMMRTRAHQVIERGVTSGERSRD